MERKYLSDLKAILLYGLNKIYIKHNIFETLVADYLQLATANWFLILLSLKKEKKICTIVAEINYNLVLDVVLRYSVIVNLKLGC